MCYIDLKKEKEKNNYLYPRRRWLKQENKNVHLQVMCESEIKISLDATSNMLI
jgi:hypothetical protein